MSIFRTAYDTKACEGFAVGKLTQEIEKALVSTWISYVPDTMIRCINGSDTLTLGIPAFAHPVVIDSDSGMLPVSSEDHPANQKDPLQVVIDVRAFGKWDQQKHDFAVRNQVEYELLVLRAKLTHIWINNPAQILRDVSPLPMAVFCSWISENVGKRYALEPQEQMRLAILAGFLYQSNFTDMKSFVERDKLRVTQAIAKATRFNAQEVLDVIDQFVEPLDGVKAFCANAYEITGSIRLKDFNIGILYQLLSKTWYGANSAEMVAVALEHPPTWLSIMFGGVIERTFKNSQIAKVIERQGQVPTRQFSQALINLVRTVSGQ